MEASAAAAFAFEAAILFHKICPNLRVFRSESKFQFSIAPQIKGAIRLDASKSMAEAAIQRIFAKQFPAAIISAS